MSDDHFKVYVDQLRDGHEAVISEMLEPDFLDVCAEDLSFKKPVSIRGTAYLASGESLILHFAIQAVGIIPCSICNEPVEVKINLSNFYHHEPLTEIKTGVFNFKEVLREAILVEAPAFAECNKGNCRKRKELEKFLKNPQDNTEEGYKPFANL